MYSFSDRMLCLLGRLKSECRDFKADPKAFLSHHGLDHAYEEAIQPLPQNWRWDIHKAIIQYHHRNTTIRRIMAKSSVIKLFNKLWIRKAQTQAIPIFIDRKQLTWSLI